MLVILLLGAPGAGKGTQAKFISQHFNIPHLSAGDMLRSEVSRESDLGLKVKSVMESGGLVNDELMIDIISSRISQDDCKNGLLLDGFPRNKEQAEALDKVLNVDIVITLEVKEEEVVRRITGRRVHIASGRVYHVDYNPPKTANQDDITKEPLTHRDDDKEDVVRNRLSIYKEKTQPLISFYQTPKMKEKTKFFSVDGMRDVSIVTDEILSILY